MSIILNDNYGYDHSEVSGHVQLDDSRIARIERVRFLKDRQYIEFSYCIAELKDGRRCYIRLDIQFSSVRNVKADLIEVAKRSKVYAKGLGLLDNISIY